MSVPDPNWNRCTDRVQTILQNAQSLAQEGQHTAVSSQHVLYALAVHGVGVGPTVLQRVGVELSTLIDELESLDLPVESRDTPPPFSAGLTRALANAKSESELLGHNYIGTEHLVLGILGLSDSTAARVLRDHGVSLEQFRSAVHSVLNT